MMITDTGTFRKRDLGMIFATGNLCRHLADCVGEEISWLAFWEANTLGALAN